MDTKKLRQKILDLAIRGKLVPQDPNDEPASVLLERIRAEKERLIAEGKIKRPKKNKASSDKNHYEDFEPPFEIPDSWEWTNIEEILINRDAERVPISSSLRKKQNNKIYDYYGAAGVIDKVDNYLFDERLLLVGEDGANLLSRVKNNAFFAEGKYWVNNHAHVLDSTDKSILDYIFYVINSYDLEPYITGSAQPKLSQDNLNRIPIPLPPINEQNRIVETISTAFNFIDIIGEHQKMLHSTIECTKSKILDLAMHGKLVSQDPADEPAADMLRRINPKAKTITDNSHYKKIPNNWAITSFTDVCDSKLGKTLNKDVDKGELHNYLCAVNVKDGFFDLNPLKRTRFIPEEFDRYSVNNGDLLVCEGGDVGRCAIWEGEKIFYQNALHRVRPLAGIEVKYLRYFLLYAKNNHWIDDLCSGVTIKHFTTKAMTHLVISIPPQREQQRIINKVEALYEILNNIERCLND